MAARILLGCYHSKALYNAFTDHGHDVTTCDLKPAEHSGKHYQGDVRELLSEDFDFAFFFPPCTYLAKAQIWRCKKDLSRADQQRQAVQFAKDLFNSPIPQVALENPVGSLASDWKHASQIVRPWWFGDPYRKEICLWLKNVPPLIATCYNPVRKSIANHTNGRMSQDLKSEIKSSWNYYPLMCEAIANQWSPTIGLSYRPVAHRFHA